MKLRYKTKPWPHQVKALKKVVRNRGGGLQVRMRWGKSWVGVYWACAMHHMESVRRVLIVTVPSGIGVWENQIMQHCPLPYEILSHHGEILQSQNDFCIQFMLVDYPNVYSRAIVDGHQWVPINNPTLIKFRPQAVIADESHHIGDPSAVQSKHTCAIARTAKFRLFMTGTMFHRKPFYVFGQMKFYDDGRTFGTSFKAFKEKIAVFGGFNNYKIERYQNLRWMMRQVRPVVYIAKGESPRPTEQNIISFRLEGEHLKAYQEMEQHSVLQVGDEVLTSEIVLTRHLRLLQISGGFVKLPSGQYRMVGHCKLDICRDRLEEYLLQDVHKVIIGCRFLPELRAVAQVAKRVGFQVILFYGGIPKGYERDRRIAKFQKTKKPTLFVAQFAAGSESIELNAADTTLWYSLPESYVTYDQFDKRKERFQDTRTLMNDFLVARGTEDEVALAAMREKMDVARYIVSNPTRVEELTAKK